MRILVTGGAGFIGSRTARLLCELEHDVVVFDDLSTGYRDLVDDRCTLVVASLSERDRLVTALSGCEAVMHFAASSIIAHSFTDPIGYVNNNVVAGTALLEAMRTVGVRRLIYSSSASVYGEPARIPVQEDDPKHPLQMYGATKLAFEHIVEAYHHAYGLHGVCLRYFNAYGPGDLQEPVTRAVPRWIQAALSGQPIRMYWRGEQFRDYVYVDDIARAHAAVLGIDGFHVFNIGSGSGILMSDVAINLETLLDRRLEIEDAGERPGDPMSLVADTTRIHRAVGWEARVPLRDGIQMAIDFYERSRPVWEPRLES